MEKEIYYTVYGKLFFPVLIKQERITNYAGKNSLTGKFWNR